jgi:hypothetical protein
MLLRSRRYRVRLFGMLAAFTLVTAPAAPVAGTTPLPNPPFAFIALTPAAAAGTVVPLVDSGQQLDGVTFEGIPDGLGVRPVGDGSAAIDIYVTHEQSHVPFGGFADFQDSSVTRVRVDVANRQVTDMEEALSPSAGFIRFCSAFMAGPAQGFAGYTFLVNEESDDVLPVPAGAPYGPDPALAPYRQAGYSVALETATGALRPLSRMGRHNHENQVVVPGGWKSVVTLSGDDTFNAPGSQLYLSTASDHEKLLADKSQLWAFQVTATAAAGVDPFDPFNDANDYLEIGVNQTWRGRFIHVPTDIARGVTEERPQAALERWSNENNVFQFVRVEDIAYDPQNPRVVYFTDTGTTRLKEDPATGRLFRAASGTPGTTNTNGRVFKMVLNASDPRIVDAFSILVDADQIGMRNPDNIDISPNSIMVQEDTSNAKVWRYERTTGSWIHVATVNHPTDPAAGESSGILNVAQWFGGGWWALDVQSHVNQSVDPAIYTYTVPITGVQMQYQKRREDGQLLLMYIPGT